MSRDVEHDARKNLASSSGGAENETCPLIYFDYYVIIFATNYYANHSLVPMQDHLITMALSNVIFASLSF